MVLDYDLFKNFKFKAAIFLGMASIIILLFITFPSIFWDNFLWKYFWGPIVADAGNVGIAYHNGVQATVGYNWINTITYALLTILTLFTFHKYLRTVEQSYFKKFSLSLIPLIIYGSVARVLEDADLFTSLSLKSFFITPLIYVQIFLLFGAVLVTAILLEHTKIKNLEPFLQ